MYDKQTWQEVIYYLQTQTITSAKYLHKTGARFVLRLNHS